MENLARWIRHTDDDQLIGVSELAVLLNTTEKQVYKLSSSAEHRIPPKWGDNKSRKLLWRLGTCRKWIRDQDSLSGSAMADSNDSQAAVRIGRPRNT